MMKFIFYCLVAYLVVRLISFWGKIGRTKEQAKTPPPGRTALSGLMVKDEMCQTYLPRENALREIIDGEERYFCSMECKRKSLEARKKGN